MNSQWISYACMVQMMSLYESLSLITKLLAFIHTASLHVKLNGLQHLLYTPSLYPFAHVSCLQIPF